MKYLSVLAVSVLVLVLSLIFPDTAFAHGVEVSDVTGQADVHTVRFSYTDGTSMLFARIKVFPPSSPDATVQESIADRDGYFSFIPFEAGDWRLAAEDGMGHRGEIIVTVDNAAAETAVPARNTAPSNKLPKAIATVLGLSLLANIFALWYFAGLRKKGATKNAH
ncbi:hypothetical protein FACS1894190_05540 [Spirochaetia bacterium]|nr:hypothetical protein FACS1894190_05540 [Spirochaetia bacterium]